MTTFDLNAPLLALGFNRGDGGKVATFWFKKGATVELVDTKPLASANNYALVFNKWYPRGKTFCSVKELTAYLAPSP